jgi:hypothetical protein
MSTDRSLATQPRPDDLFGPPISTYSRADALADGVLIDVTETAFEAGFKWPVALTRAAWENCVAWSEQDTARQTVQDEAGRLWDVLWMALFEIQRSPHTKTDLPLLFQLHRVPRGGRGRRPRLTTLALQAGPGDDGKPVMTIALPDEC